MRLLVMAFALAACGPASAGYPPEYEVNFMQACTDGGPQGFCSCVWRKIEAEIPVRDFIAYDRMSETARAAHPVHQQMTGYFQTCLAQTPTP